MTEDAKRGRPEHKVTDEDREKVRVLKAGGMSNEAIAEAIGIAVKTLTKHFFPDLEIASAKVTADLLMARYQSAIGGNVSAQNKMLEQVGAVRAQNRRAPTEPKPEKLGKKEERQAAAKRVGGRFAPPPAPKLVVSNG